MPLQISPKPLPDSARNAAYASLKSCRFDPKTMIVENYAFTGRRGETVRANALAFAHKTYRTPDYTGVTLFNSANGTDEHTAVQLLAHSAAPFYLIHQNEKRCFSFWFCNVSDREAQDIDLDLIESEISYDRLNQALSPYERDLNPQRIIDVKHQRETFGNPRFRESGAFQLHLWAIDVTRPLLVKHFGEAVGQLKAYHDDTNSSIPVSDIAVQLLGAMVLSHTGVLTADMPQDDPPIDELIYIAHKKYPDYFDPKLFETWKKPAEQAYDTFKQLRYSGFAPDMLTELYKEAYPDPEQRRKSGRYDTPLYLTRRIWENIPVEFLPPEKRVVADMTCGWGSFLIAGYERLSQMIDMEEQSPRKYIHGNDVEPFTARLARLGLLISSLEDSWHIDNEDAIKWKWLARRRPNIIVGNPPFAGNRKTTKGQEKRFQAADQYLEHAIDRLADGGYLAMLMPQSFVAAEASPGLRRKLLEMCDVQELWDLPKGTFKAGANAVFVFARKKAASASRIFPVRVRTVQKKTLTNFEETGIVTVSSIASDQSSWGEYSRRSKGSSNTHIMDYKMILPQYYWNKIQSHCIGLTKLADAFVGAIEGDDPARKSWKDYPKPKKVYWLTDAKKIIKDSFNIVYDSATTITYPNDLEKPRLDKEHLLAGKKILLASNVDPSWGKRTKVVIERRGYYVSGSFWVIVPNPPEDMMYITHEVIAAILDWKVSNAWIIEHLKHTKIPSRTVKTIPFPNLSPDNCESLENAVYEIEKAVSAGKERPIEATQTIDTILKAAYQLDDETYERLRLVAEWDTNPQITLDEQPDPNARWHTSGIVDSIDAKNGTITLWLNSHDGLHTVPISPVMPGWLLRPEVAFRARIPRQCVRRRRLDNVSWGKFYPQDYTYLSEEELFNELAEVLNSS